MSIFRSIVEDLIRKVYVEGLSLKEACEVYTEDYYLDQIRRKQEEHDNVAILKSKLNKRFKSKGEKDKKEKKEKPEIQLYAKIMSDGSKGWNKDGNSFYGYYKKDIDLNNIKQEYKDKLLNEFTAQIPFVVAVRISSHSTTDIDDLDVLVPGKQFNNYKYLVNDENSNYLYVNRKTGELENRMIYKFKPEKYMDEYADAGYAEINGVLDEFINPRSDRYLIGDINKALEYIYRHCTDENKASIINERLSKYYLKNPFLKIWASQLLDNIINNEALNNEIAQRRELIEEIKRLNPQDSDILIAQAGNLVVSLDRVKENLAQQVPAQDKAASFQQAIQKTAALDKMAQTQKDFNTVVPSPDQER